MNPTSAWAAITPVSALFRALGLSAGFPRSPFANPEALPAWDRRTDREVDVASGFALLIRTEVWQASGGFDERYWMYGEEAEWQMRLRPRGFGRPRIMASARFVHDNDETSQDTSAGWRRSMMI